MNLVEISDKYGIPVKKLARLEKDGFLVASKTDSRPAQMKIYLQSGRPLAVHQLIDLIREPGLIPLIGKTSTYRDMAASIVESLGNVEASALPVETAANIIYGAAILDPDMTARLVEWLRGVIPAKGCSYHYLAVRMMFNVPGARWKETYRYLPRAMTTIRNHPLLEGWSYKEGKEPVKFQRPANSFIDL